MKKQLPCLSIFCFLFLLISCSKKDVNSTDSAGLDVKFVVPVWQKDVTGKYPYSMTAVVKLSDSLQSAVNPSENDKIGAFINGECRGTGIAVATGSSFLYYLLIEGTASEKSTVTFKYYNSLAHSTYSTIPLIKFSVDSSFGSPDKPVILPMVLMK